MTNEELAEFLCKQDCKCCVYRDIDCSGQSFMCSEGILQWSNQESEGQ
jgi:hypothetical protein